MTKRIYIAAASSERERARATSVPLLAAGWSTTAWWDEEAAPPGGTDLDVAPEVRERIKDRCIEAAHACDVFFLLSPNEGHSTIGAWVELGAALAQPRPRQYGSDIIIAGRVPLTLFVTSSRWFERDEDAIEYLSLGAARAPRLQGRGRGERL